jgi:hypothetical protein
MIDELYGHERCGSGIALLDLSTPGVETIRYAFFRTLDFGVLGLDSGFETDSPIQTGGPYEQCTRTGGRNATCDSDQP